MKIDVILTFELIILQVFYLLFAVVISLIFCIIEKCYQLEMKENEI